MENILGTKLITQIGILVHDIEATSHAVIGMMVAAIMNVLRHPDDAAGHERFGAAVLALMLGGVVAPGAASGVDAPVAKGAAA